jgi:hypothetical protein
MFLQKVLEFKAVTKFGEQICFNTCKVSDFCDFWRRNNIYLPSTEGSCPVAGGLRVVIQNVPAIWKQKVQEELHASSYLPYINIFLCVFCHFFNFINSRYSNPCYLYKEQPLVSFVLLCRLWELFYISIIIKKIMNTKHFLLLWAYYEQHVRWLRL